jgi:hypothetical protein
MKPFKLITGMIILFTFFQSSNSFADGYVNSTSWLSNAMLSMTTKGWVTSSIKLFVDPGTAGTVKVGDYIYFKDKDIGDFKITMIYKERTSINDLRDAYNHLYKDDIKNIDLFSNIISSYSNNNVYTCWIGWSSSRQPDEYLTVNPCR